mmetsp:Transcript_6645/g.16919  ORF Transcript_6645/g.16919 Transcript_6645/m.16919 type:complete len:235 (-) Transcript_6645:163-867(-)
MRMIPPSLRVLYISPSSGTTVSTQGPHLPFRRSRLRNVVTFGSFFFFRATSLDVGFNNLACSVSLRPSTLRPLALKASLNSGHFMRMTLALSSGVASRSFSETGCCVGGGGSGVTVPIGSVSSSARSSQLLPTREQVHGLPSSTTWSFGRSRHFWQASHWAQASSSSAGGGAGVATALVCFCLLIGVFGSSAASAAASRARALALRGRDDWRAAGILVSHTCLLPRRRLNSLRS